MNVLPYERHPRRIALPEPVTVSVVVPTRDRPALLDEALASIRAIEGSDLRFEILVGDNGDDPETMRIAERHGARHIRVATPGAAATRNAALRAATGEYIAFLDDDDAWLPGHVRPQLLAMRTNPAFAACVGQVANAAPDLASHGPFWPVALPADGDLFASFLEAYPQIGATVVRASVRESVGMFDETLINDQDWDWHLRLALAHQVGFVAAPSVLFRQRAVGADDALQWRRLHFFRKVYWRNVRRAGKRRPSPRVLVRTFLRHSGTYEAYFAASARDHARRGQRKRAAGALGRALRASPPHALRDLVRASDFRAALRGVITGHRTPATGVTA